MSKIANSILKGAEEALEYAKGKKISASVHKVKIPKLVDVRRIRQSLQMTREEFSNTFGFSIRTLEKWERHERQPTGSARAYLIVIDKNPSAVKEALIS